MDYPFLIIETLANNNDQVVFAILIATFALIALVGFIIAFILLYQKRRSFHKQEMDQIKSVFEQTLLKSRLEIQEQTLQNISHELHDNLGQVASLIKINLNTLDKTNSGYTTKLEDTKDLIRQLIMDLKLLSRSLNSESIMQIGLKEAILRDLNRLQKSTPLKINFEHSELVPELDDQKSIIFYRIVQELLNNIIQHSQATSIHIILRVSQDLFILEVRDDGVGFDVGSSGKNGSSGLNNLKSRAQMLNAKLSIKSTPATGTTIIIEMPL